MYDLLKTLPLPIYFIAVPLVLIILLLGIRSIIVYIILPIVRFLQWFPLKLNKFINDTITKKEEISEIEKIVTETAQPESSNEKEKMDLLFKKDYFQWTHQSIKTGQSGPTENISDNAFFKVLIMICISLISFVLGALCYKHFG